MEAHQYEMAIRRRQARGLAVDHVSAAHAAGWRLAELEEGVIDDAWIAAKAKWERYRHRPVSFAFVWEKRS